MMSPNILQGLKVLIDWREEGCEIVFTANDGLCALNWLRKNRADLVLLDIQMPVMDGLEMLEVVKRENLSGATFVILSGYDDFSFA